MRNFGEEGAKQALMLLKELLKKDIDAVAVTKEPGLIGSLMVGINTAKTISLCYNKTILPYFGHWQ